MSKKSSTSAHSVKRHPVDEKVAHILDAVIEIVARHGLENFRLHDVAVEAGVSVGAIQHHFQSRAVLVDRALSRYAMQSIDEVVAASTGAQVSAWDELCDTLRAVAYRTELESRDRIWVMINASATTNIQHLRIVQATHTRWEKMFREIIMRGITEDTFDPIVSIEDTEECLMTLIDGTALRNAVYGVPSPETVEHIEANYKRFAAWLLRPSM